MCNSGLTKLVLDGRPIGQLRAVKSVVVAIRGFGLVDVDSGCTCRKDTMLGVRAVQSNMAA